MLNRDWRLSRRDDPVQIRISWSLLCRRPNHKVAMAPFELRNWKKKKSQKRKPFFLGSLTACRAGWANKSLTMYRCWPFTLDYLSIFLLWPLREMASQPISHSDRSEELSLRSITLTDHRWSLTDSLKLSILLLDDLSEMNATLFSQYPISVEFLDWTFF